MAEILFTLSFDKINKTITVTDDSSGVTPTTISVYIKTEDKNSYVYKFYTEEVADINAFLNPNVGLVITPDIFITSIPDNFYIVSIVIDEGLETMKQSEWHVFTMTDYVTAYIETNALSVNFPPQKALTSIMFDMALQTVKLLLLISDSTVYTYERENKWRKLYNAIIIAVDEYQY